MPLKVEEQGFEYVIICTAQVADSKMKISTNIWNELGVTDAKSYLNCNSAMSQVLSHLLQSASTPHLLQTNTHASSLNDCIVF